jgi:hypothetical protein
MSFTDFLAAHADDDTAAGDSVRDTLTDLEWGCLNTRNAFLIRRHIRIAHPQSERVGLGNFDDVIVQWAMESSA